MNQIWLKNRHRFFIFGAGKLGLELMQTLKRFRSFACFVDNDIEKQRHGWYGGHVISLDAYKARDNKDLLVLACSEKHRKNIELQMQASGMLCGYHYLYIKEFLQRVLPLYVCTQFHENYVSLSQICVTERCTLKCKKCAHGCYAVPRDAQDMSLDMVKASADNYFAHVDYTGKFHLIGGEPLLYNDLSQAVEYIGSHYGPQIQTLCITTNGTIVPGDDVLQACKRYNVLVLISNYSVALPRLVQQHEKLTRTLSSWGIKFVLGEADKEWTDYGFDYVDRGAFSDKLSNDKVVMLRKVFDACDTNCREVRGSKLYYCVQARACAENLGYPVGQADYLDLGKLDQTIESKQRLAEFESGVLDKGFLDMCNYCNGSERFLHLIPAAEQEVR